MTGFSCRNSTSSIAGVNIISDNLPSALLLLLVRDPLRLGASGIPGAIVSCRYQLVRRARDVWLGELGDFPFIATREGFMARGEMRLCCKASDLVCMYFCENKDLGPVGAGERRGKKKQNKWNWWWKPPANWNNLLCGD